MVVTELWSKTLHDTNLDEKIYGQQDRGIKCIARTMWINAISTKNVAGEFALINDKLTTED